MGNKCSRLAGHLTLVVLAVWGCTELGDEVSPHSEGWADPLTDAFHGIKIRATNFDLTNCHSCHGDDLQGTPEVAGCSSATCHTGEAGVYACDNCHGYLDSDPFSDVEGRTSTDSVTVGVHTSHYTSLRGITSNVSCSSCHLVPDSAPDMDTGHIDETPYAEVIFDSLAIAAHAGALEPTWDRSTATCANTYCHGNFTYERTDSSGKFVIGNILTMTWTAPVEGNLCGTCHGLPPAGHSPYTEGTSCGLSFCHNGVVNLDNDGNYMIADPARHLDGQPSF